MKEGWKEVRLGDYITDIAAGPFGSNLKTECFVADGFPIIDGANLKGFRVTDNITKFVTENKARSLNRSIARRNDVVVTISGTVGQIAYIPSDSKYEEYLCSQRQFRATFDESQINVSYLVYYFHSYIGRQKILAFANQVGVPALAQPLKNFREIIISLPPLPVQRRIAAVLGALDDKIELNRKMNKNLEEQAQALFKAWFIDFEPFGGKMPKDWKKGTAEDFYNVTIGKTPPRKNQELFSKDKKGNIVWVSIADMGTCGAFISQSSEYLTSVAIKTYNINVVPSGTVLLSFKLTIGRVAIANCELSTNEAIAHFVPKDNVCSVYTYLFLKSYNFARLGNTSSIATAINSKMVRAMPFVLPNVDVLNRFDALISPLFARIAGNIEESRKLAEMRDALLPKLMSGEIEV